MCTILFVLIMMSSAYAEFRITSDNGGRIGDYDTRYRTLRNSGEQVVIDGSCLSACTMVLGLIPRERLCATHNAVLGFHAAWDLKDGRKVLSKVASQALLDIYPLPIRSWIFRHGGLGPAMIYLRGRELAAHVLPCRQTPIDVRAERSPALRSLETGTRAHEHWRRDFR